MHLNKVKYIWFQNATCSFCKTSLLNFISNYLKHKKNRATTDFEQNCVTKTQLKHTEKVNFSKAKATHFVRGRMKLVVNSNKIS